MLNDDDSTIAPDHESGTDADESDDISAASPPRTGRARTKAAQTSAKAASKAPSGKTDKSSAKAEKKAKKKAKARAEKKPAKTATAVPAGFARVKAGSHSVWVTRELSRALSPKDRRKLKTLLKRAAKRKKSA